MKTSKGSVRPVITTQLGAALVSMVGFAAAASASTVHVCATCAHKTIQSAVNDAASGDSIQIAAGTYTENVTIAGKALTLTGEADDTGSKVSVFGAGRGPVFTLGDAVTGSTTYTVELHNLAVSGGNHTNSTGQGGGIQVRSGAQLGLYNSTVSHNIATSGGGVSFNNPAASLNVIRDSSITNNVATGYSEAAAGGGISLLSGQVNISNSTVSQNAAIDGGGIFAAAGASLQLVGSNIIQNRVFAIPDGNGGGPGTTTWVGANGGGLYIASAYSLSNDVIASNISNSRDSRGGSGLYIDAVSAVDLGLQDTVVTHNVSGNGHGAIAIFGLVSKVFTLTNDYVVQNTGGGISTIPTIVLSNSTVTGNTPYDCDGNGCSN